MWIPAISRRWRAACRPSTTSAPTPRTRPPSWRSRARRGAPNPAAYDGPEVAAQQKKGYPDLGPLTLPAPPDRAFAAAGGGRAAAGLGDRGRRPREGRLEATATTPWFGFKDDVVVRVTAAGSGSRVDVRSKSRVGRSDLGANAKRIRAFLAELSARLAA